MSISCCWNVKEGLLLKIPTWKVLEKIVWGKLFQYLTVRIKNVQEYQTVLFVLLKHKNYKINVPNIEKRRNGNRQVKNFIAQTLVLMAVSGTQWIWFVCIPSARCTFIWTAYCRRCRRLNPYLRNCWQLEISKLQTKRKVRSRTILW